MAMWAGTLLPEGIMPATDVVTGGKRVLAYGCGDFSKCWAYVFLGGGARVLVTEGIAFIRTMQVCLEVIRSGSAPSWEEEYDSIELRTASHKALFDMLDLRHGPPRWRIGLEQFADSARYHLFLRPQPVGFVEGVR